MTERVEHRIKPSTCTYCGSYRPFHHLPIPILHVPINQIIFLAKIALQSKLHPAFVGHLLLFGDVCFWVH